jgi:hypothetical protein
MLCFDESWKNLTERIGELPSHETFSQCLYKTRAVLWEIISKKPFTIGQIWEYYTILRLQEEEKLFEMVHDRTARLLYHQPAVPPFASASSRSSSIVDASSSSSSSSSSSVPPASPVRSSSSIPPPVVIDPSNNANNYILYHRSPSVSNSTFPSSSSSMIHPGGGFVDNENREISQDDDDSSNDDSDGGFNDFDNHEEPASQSKGKEKARTPVRTPSSQSLHQQQKQQDVFTIEEGDLNNVQQSSSNKQPPSSSLAGIDISSPISNHIRDLEVNDRPSSSVPGIIGASSSSSFVPNLRSDSAALRHYQQTGEVNEYLNASMTAEALKAELAVTWKKTFMGITTNIYGGSKILTMKHINQLEAVRIILFVALIFPLLPYSFFRFYLQLINVMIGNYCIGSPSSSLFIPPADPFMLSFVLPSFI